MKKKKKIKFKTKNPNLKIKLSNLIQSYKNQNFISTKSTTIRRFLLNPANP